MSSGRLPRCACSTRTMASASRQGLHLPHALAAIAAILLEHARAVRLQARRKFGAEGCGAVIAMRVGAPAQMTRSVEHVLDAHLQDDVGMRAHPRALRRNLAKQRIERRARLALMDRIDPDEHAVDGEQLIADRVGEKSRRRSPVAHRCRQRRVLRKRGRSGCFARSRPGARQRRRARGWRRYGGEDGGVRCPCASSTNGVLRRAWTEVSRGVCFVPTPMNVREIVRSLQDGDGAVPSRR